jgi:hypothetical protein
VAWNRHIRETELLQAKLYANDSEVPIVSIFSTDAYTYTPYTYPDDMATAHKAFNTDNLYHNSLNFYTQGGDITVGIRKTASANSDWCCFDNFTLTYLGPGTGIKTVIDSQNNYKAIYNLIGQRVDNSAQHGIYISNGKKITIK